MDDDFDDYELFLSTIVSHFRLLTKSVVILSQICLNWQTVSRSTHRFFALVMRPQTLALLAVMLVLALVCHTFEYWLRSLTRSTIKFVKRLNVGLSPASTALTTYLPNVECITRIGSDNVIHEYKDNCVGVYALQGRCPKMEDRFTYANDSDRLGVEYWAVYDSHGGNVSTLCFI